VGAPARQDYLADMNRTDVGLAALTQASLDYQRIERAIRYLQAHFLEQPALTTVARAAHLSEYHFQRLFSRWAGISPKRFLQFLTLEHAKQQLAESKAVLATALDSGLSGPGRLHDLFVAAEAVTPGEFKSRGAGVRIEYGFHPTRFGPCLLGLTPRGICWLSFLSDSGERAALQELKSHWGGASFGERPDATGAVINRIFPSLEGRQKSPPNLLLMGTNFQIKVWRALLEIPAGAVVSYQTIGARIGAPSAARAIGSAMGQNAVSYLIPCHRVIRTSGSPGGYRWGEERKRAMLAWEAARTQPARVHE
jgi:AraC family transcriptional regulator, regulatory protein of adaptative response / methylated-DNA-[protein]-cysteine methyltransferase